MIPALLFVAAPALAVADAPQIGEVRAKMSAGTWRFDVTLSHPDTGWDHYADGWRIETPDGDVLGTRVLAHPHVTEQPFTRSQGGITIPSGLDRVLVRASCNVDGWATDGMTFILPK